MAQILVPPQNFGYDMRYSPHGVTGFEYSGNQYIFACEGNEGLAGNTYKIHVQKSTNSGATWSETATVSFSNSGHGSATAYTVCVDGGTAYILAVDTWGANADDTTTDLCTPLQMWTYNLSTDGIAGPSSPGGSPQFYKFWHGTAPNGFQVNKCVSIHLVRRGAGDMLLVYSGIYEIVSGHKQARLYVAPFNGSSVGSSTMIPGQTGNDLAYTSGAVDIDASGYLHVVFVAVPTGKVYEHVAMDGSGNFGTASSVDANGHFSHLDPPEEMSRLVVWGSSIGFVGVREDGGNGAIYFYSAAAGQLNPSWTSSSVSNSTPVVINPRNTSCISTAAAFLVDNTIHVFWARSGDAINGWDASDNEGCIRHVSASTSNLSSWSSETTVLDNTPVGGNWAAANVNAWTGTSIIGVFGTFDQNDGTQFGSFLAISASSADYTRSASDTLTITDLLGTNIPRASALVDALAFADGPPQTQLSGIGGGGGGGNPPSPAPGSGMGNCIFEFYEMQTPADVEVLPTPKRYDQLGPMRFDKIGKVFGFRIRLIMTGSTTALPWAVYGDDSESDPQLNSIFYQGSLSVRPQIDNVYEVQFPKSVNTDVFRLTIGPTGDAFHRYDVQVKVHISGMQGQAKWLPIR